MNINFRTPRGYQSIFRMYVLFCPIFLFFALLIQTVNPCSALELLESDNGRAFTIFRSEEITISLPGNPTTGYQWEVLTSESTLLQQKGKSSFVTDANRVGAGGKTTFLFIPCGIGSTRLKLVYRRPWEKETPPIQVFEINVTVKQNMNTPISGFDSNHNLFHRGLAE